MSRAREIIDDELHYLRWFKETADFGFADGVRHLVMDVEYEGTYPDRKVPVEWRTK